MMTWQIFHKGMIAEYCNNSKMYVVGWHDTEEAYVVYFADNDGDPEMWDVMLGSFWSGEVPDYIIELPEQAPLPPRTFTECKNPNCRRLVKKSELNNYGACDRCNHWTRRRKRILAQRKVEK